MSNAHLHSKYDSWRTRILVLMMASYCFYFLARTCLNFVAPIMSGNESIGFSKQDFGYLISVWSLFYAIGKLTVGFISIYFSPRRLMFLGLLGSGIVNVIFPFMDGIWGWAVLWGLAGLFQSIGWPQCVRLMTHWYRPSEMGTKWGIASTSNQIGTKLMYGLFWLISIGMIPMIGAQDWKGYFWLTGSIAIIVSLVISRSPLFTPERMGLPTKEERYDLPKPDVFEDKNQTFMENTYKIIFKDILPNKMIWYIAFANLFFYVMRTGYTAWAPTFLFEHKHFDMTSVSSNMFTFEFAGIAGGIIAGLISDKLFKGRRGLVGATYMGLVIVALTYLYYAPFQDDYLPTIFMFFLGFVFFGPQIMAGAASVDFATKRAAVAANSFVGFFANTGSSLVSGALLGGIAETHGWGAVFAVLIGSTFLGAFFFWLTRNGRAPEKKKKKKPAVQSA